MCRIVWSRLLPGFDGLVHLAFDSVAPLGVETDPRVNLLLRDCCRSPEVDDSTEASRCEEYRENAHLCTGLQARAVGRYVSARTTVSRKGVVHYRPILRAI